MQYIKYLVCNKGAGRDTPAAGKKFKRLKGGWEVRFTVPRRYHPDLPFGFFILKNNQHTT